MNFYNLILKSCNFVIYCFRHTFEICQRDSQRVIFKCESMEDKNDWMAALVMLNTKSMLERTLDVILMDEENRHPLRLPDASQYR